MRIQQGFFYICLGLALESMLLISCKQYKSQAPKLLKEDSAESLEEKELRELKDSILAENALKIQQLQAESEAKLKEIQEQSSVDSAGKQSDLDKLNEQIAELNKKNQEIQKQIGATKAPDWTLPVGPVVATKLLSATFKYIDTNVGVTQNCLDVHYGATSIRTRITSWTCQNLAQQKFDVVTVKDSNGVYLGARLVPQNAPTLCLGMLGITAILDNCDTTGKDLTQFWTYIRVVSTGSVPYVGYKISNKSNDNCLKLDVDNFAKLLGKCETSYTLFTRENL